MKFKSFSFSEPFVFPGSLRKQTGVDVLRSAAGVVFQLPANDVPGPGLSVPADLVLPVCAEMLGVDAQYLALCVALAKGVTVYKAGGVFADIPLRLLSVGIVTSVVCDADGNTEKVENYRLKIKTV